jgi:hypothetical protein
MKNGRTFARAGWTVLGAVSLPLCLSACSVLGDSERFASLPETCFEGISAAVDAAVGPLASQGRKDDLLPEDAAISRPSGSTKFCARSFSDTVNRRDWKQGEPNFRKVFLQYALYRSGFLSEGVDDAKRELKPPLVDPKRLVAEPKIGDESVGWWDYSQSQGASWQISLRVSNMRVLVRVSGADYLSDYTVDRQFSARLDYDSQRLKDELRREAQSVAKAAVEQLEHPSPPRSA